MLHYYINLIIISNAYETNLIPNYLHTFTIDTHPDSYRKGVIILFLLGSHLTWELPGLITGGGVHFVSRAVELDLIMDDHKNLDFASDGYPVSHVNTVRE